VTSTTYALITPVRDEEENLRKLAASIEKQTVSPMAWVIVDNGSRDETAAFANELAQRDRRITVASAPGTQVAEPGMPIVRAFHFGLEVVRRLYGELPDVIVKLDADVTVDERYFELLLRAFEDDPRLGIASGVCLERADGDYWAPTFVTRAHVRGATRAYRRDCLEQILPLEEGMGWDTIDELRANVEGWQTRIVEDIHFYHHRSVGERDGSGHVRWERQGTLAHYIGYRPSYLLARTLHQARRNPAALAMLWGYLKAAATAQRRYEDERVRARLRDDQRLRRLPTRAREALGRRAR
jgi:biofilm PGA synthesis N-glycosyltransferase PgaC